MSIKETYYKRKAQHKCCHCGKSDTRTQSGKTVCLQCTEKNKEKQRKQANEYYAEHREEQKAAQRARFYIQYHNRQENHECVTCGVKLPEDYYYVNCADCHQKQKEYAIRHYREKKNGAKNKVHD